MARFANKNLCQHTSHWNGFKMSSSPTNMQIKRVSKNYEKLPFSFVTFSLSICQRGELILFFLQSDIHMFVFVCAHGCTYACEENAAALGVAGGRLTVNPVSLPGINL